MERRFVRKDELVKILNISKATLWRWVRSGNFPKPIRLGDRIVVWDLEEVYEHIKNKKQ